MIDIKIMITLIITINNSQYLNSVFSNDLNNLKFVFIYFIINLIYDLTDRHILIEILKFILIKFRQIY